MTQPIAYNTWIKFTGKDESSLAFIGAIWKSESDSQLTHVYQFYPYASNGADSLVDQIELLNELESHTFSRTSEGIESASFQVVKVLSRGILTSYSYCKDI